MDHRPINGTRVHTEKVRLLDSPFSVIVTAASAVPPRVVGLCVLAFLIGVASTSRAEEQDLIQNGSFKQTSGDSVPTVWTTSGRHEIEQTLMVDNGRDGRHAAKLSCLHFVGGTPDSHVMICRKDKEMRNELAGAQQ